MTVDRSSTVPLIETSRSSRPVSASAVPASFSANLPGISSMQRRGSTGGAAAVVAASGVADWLVIIGIGVGGYFLGNLTPNKRPFQLEDPDISFPYTVHETVSSGHLVLATVLVPIVVILLVSLTLVPGGTVPPGTPRSLVWKRKLWEFYASLLAYAVGMVAQYFIINCLKNVCGKPRPDLIARCQPDLQNLAQHVVGGIANITYNGQLVSASICTNTDTHILDDGFRSYPSGHSSSSAAGLGHVALYLAYKFGVVFPFSAISRFPNSAMLSAFPSRLPVGGRRDESYELADRTISGSSQPAGETQPGGAFGAFAKQQRNNPVYSARRSNAAPPLYLLLIAVIPFGASVFIAASRWYNYRHHGFDILFGYFIGATTTLVAFRLYYLPMSRGAGWAWGPRCADKAFWAGVGSDSWSTPRRLGTYIGVDEEEGLDIPTRR